MNPEQRDQELKNKDLQLNRDAEGKDVRRADDDYKKHVTKMLDYHSKEFEFWRKESLRLIQT